jgi:hypothetical protein
MSHSTHGYNIKACVQNPHTTMSNFLILEKTAFCATLLSQGPSMVTAQGQTCWLGVIWKILIEKQSTPLVLVP